MKKLFILFFIFTCFNSFTQKKILDHSDFDIWNRIQSPQIAAEGNHLIYSIQTGEKDSKLKIKDNQGNLIFQHNRSEDGLFTYDAKFAVFKIKPWKDSITEMKRRKVKKDKMPIDTLGIFSLEKLTLQKISNVKSYKIPQKWSGFIAYTFDNSNNKAPKKNQDTTSKKKISKKLKKASSKNGYPLVIHELNNSIEDTIPYVTNYTFSKDANTLAYTTTGIKDSIQAGVYVKNLKSNVVKHVYNSHHKTKYFKLSLSDSGKNLAFVVDADSTKSYNRPKYSCCYDY